MPRFPTSLPAQLWIALNKIYTKRHTVLCSQRPFWWLRMSVSYPRTSVTSPSPPAWLATGTLNPL